MRTLLIHKFLKVPYCFFAIFLLFGVFSASARNTSKIIRQFKLNAHGSGKIFYINNKFLLVSNHGIDSFGKAGKKVSSYKFRSQFEGSCYRTISFLNKIGIQCIQNNKGLRKTSFYQINFNGKVVRQFTLDGVFDFLRV